MLGSRRLSLNALRSIWFRMRFSNVSSRSVSPMRIAPCIRPSLRTTLMYSLPAIYEKWRNIEGGSRYSTVSTFYTYLWPAFHFDTQMYRRNAVFGAIHGTELAPNSIITFVSLLGCCHSLFVLTAQTILCFRVFASHYSSPRFEGPHPTCTQQVCVCVGGGEYFYYSWGGSLL